MAKVSIMIYYQDGEVILADKVAKVYFKHPTAGFLGSDSEALRLFIYYPIQTMEPIKFYDYEAFDNWLSKEEVQRVPYIFLE